MPITFDPTNDIFTGTNDFGTTLAGFDFSVFGGFISNAGAIEGTVTGNSANFVEINNTAGGTISKPSDSSFAIDFQGTGTRRLSNDGEITGAVRTGDGFDFFNNSGLLTGPLSTGAGDDQITNQILLTADGTGLSVGTITGTINTGAGNDLVLNSGILHDVRLGAGNDTYTANPFGTDGVGLSGDVRGEAGDDHLTGGDAGEHFFGGNGNDTLAGNGGRDQLFGGNGDDQISGGDGNDLINGGAGNDFIDGGSNNDLINGGSGNDVIFAGQGNDRANGGNGDDFISGDAGNDRLSGGSGSDTLEGGQGRDVLSGGADADTFVFAGRTNRDTITDFGAGDLIRLDFGAGPAASFGDVIANTTFSGSNAIIDLSAVFNLVSTGGPRDNGSVLTLRNVDAADLTESAFEFFSDDIFTVG